ncbi:MAG TPA: VOC family protein, partial [Enteractinococcus sp.]
MTGIPRITPNIWFPGNAGEAVEFYTAAFGEGSEILHTVSHPETGLPDFQRSFAGQLLVADISLRGYRLTAINAGERFTPTPA